MRTFIKICTAYNTPNDTKSPVKNNGQSTNNRRGRLKNGKPDFRRPQPHKEHIMRIAELDRINELARKAKTIGLSEAETAERDVLRQAYIRQVCGQINNMLSTVTVVDPEGTDVTPAKLREAQAAGMQQMH